MSLVFLVLKAARVIETPYDFPIAFLLVDLDLILAAELRRLWLYHRQGR